MADVLQVLTPEQLARWDELTGKKFVWPPSGPPGKGPQPPFIP
jgi:hypothetical protein